MTCRACDADAVFDGYCRECFAIRFGMALLVSDAEFARLRTRTVSSPPANDRRCAESESLRKAKHMTPSGSIGDLLTNYETAITKYQNDQTQVSTDQTKIASLQTTLTNDQAAVTVDGAAAFTAGAALISALQAQQALLPQPEQSPAAPAQ